MKYTFELNISSITTPSNLGGWVEVTPLKVGNMGKKLEQKQLFARSYISGNIQFYSDVNEALTTLVESGEQQTECRVKYNGTVAVTGIMSLLVENNETESIGGYQIKTASDGYTEITSNYSEKYNVLDLYKQAMFCDMPYTDLVFNLNAFTDGFTGALFYTNTTPAFQIYARRQLRVNTSKKNSLVLDGWTSLVDYSDNTHLVVRNWNHSGTPYATPSSADIVDYGSVSTGQINSRIHLVSGTTPAAYTRLYQDTGVSTWVLKDYDYYENAYVKTAFRWFPYNRSIRLDAAIINLIQQIDSNIKFDQLSFFTLTNNINYRHIIINQVSDFILTETYSILAFGTATKQLISKSNEATKGEMSMKSIFDDYLTPLFGIYWYLELKDGDYYFRITEYRAKTYAAASSGNDLTTYKTNNVTTGGNNYKYNQIDYFYKMIRQVIAEDIDHIGNDKIIEKYKDTAENKELNVNIFSDIHDSIDSKYSGEEKYPITTDAWFIAACDPFGAVGIGSGFRTFGNLTYAYAGLDLTLTGDNTTNSAGWFETEQPSGQVIRKGQIVNVTFTLTVMQGSLDKWSLFLHIQDLTDTPTDRYVELTIQSGLNNIWITIDDDIKINSAQLNLRFEVTNQIGVTNEIELANIVNSSYYTQYFVKHDIAMISGIYKTNAMMSLANIDDRWGVNNIPASLITINGSSVVVDDDKRAKSKEYEFIALHDTISDVDEDTYIETDFDSELIFDEVEIPLDGSTGKIKVRGI